jgi:hypothetical protein
MVSSEKRTRGPNRQTRWVRKPDDGMSVLRLALDTSDPLQRGRIEAMFRAGYAVRRAVQRDARDRARAYWAARHERARDPAGARDRLGLSRTALEHAAYGHLDAAPHLRRFVTKALAMHLADSVWTATERHLFPDARGQRFGMPGVGRWYDFARLPGRARSHTTENKWETYGDRLLWGGAGRSLRLCWPCSVWASHNAAPPKVLEPGEQVAGRELVARQFRQRRRERGDGRLLHAEVDFHVAVGGRKLRMSEPGRNRGDVDASLEQVHRGRVAHDVR